MEKIVTVSELSSAISSLLAEGIGFVLVQGEISNFKSHSSGHKYFTLKDEHAQISCTVWRSRRMNFLPEDGMKVIVTGELTVYPPQGKYQIECSSIKQVGQGELYLAFEMLKKKLEAKGMFETARKRAIPELPLTIGISTSPTGAAIQDMLSTINRRMPVCTIYFRPTLVQGEGSAEDIAQAIDDLNSYSPDVIIIGRGGGSIEDLWSYNTEIVANAIVCSKIPVISAVGHEIDFTIADFAADMRAATPTAAAELVTKITQIDIYSHLEFSEDEMLRNIRDTIESNRDFILNLEKSYAFRQITDKVRVFIQQTDEYQNKAEKKIAALIKLQKTKIQSAEAHLSSLHPLNPLRKGFAYLSHNGEMIYNNISLLDYDKIKIHRAYETASAEITDVDNRKKNL